MGAPAGEPRDHGEETLQVWQGEVVGRSGDDVFVELGPRMQGVISVREFDEPPEEGEEFEFTLRGQEQGLWALSRRETRALATWENLEPGSVVQARVTAKNYGGLELKVGPLHAFMPKSQVGGPRNRKLNELVGRNITCEVIEVDDARQRVVLSRKLVAKREKESQLQRLVGSLRPGQVVQGRVVRIEDYGVFVKFGHGMQGLIHISDMSLDRVEHPRELVKKGEVIEAKVLGVKGGGQRISLGMKQMEEDPWQSLERYIQAGQVVQGKVMHLMPYGAFIEVQRGVEGLLHISQMQLEEGRSVREFFKLGQQISVRVLSMECDRKRMSLSLLHENGRRIRPEEAANDGYFREVLEKKEPESDLGTNLGDVLKRALS